MLNDVQSRELSPTGLMVLSSPGPAEAKMPGPIAQRVRLSRGPRALVYSATQQQLQSQECDHVPGERTGRGRNCTEDSGDLVSSSGILA